MKNQKKKKQTRILTGRERKVERRNDHQQQTVRPRPTCSSLGGRAHDIAEGYSQTNSGITCAIERAQAPPTCRGMKNTHQQLFGI